MKRWYASVMLNRLMFIYFIQKKRFIAGDPDYLSHRLADSKKRGKDRFIGISFARYSLKASRSRSGQRIPKMTKPLGTVPYLNGSLLKHQIEELYGKQIDIPDAAFDNFLPISSVTTGTWTTGPQKPAEKSIPTCSATSSKNILTKKRWERTIPRKISPNTFARIPSFLRSFITPMKVVALPLKANTRFGSCSKPIPTAIACLNVARTRQEIPDAISAGIADVSKRKAWHKAASAEYALPTETWQEVVARRTRMVEVRRVVAAGEVQSINDLIRLNLDMCRFAEEVISNAEGPELVRAFYRGLHHLSVLDPACGLERFCSRPLICSNGCTMLV